MRYSIVREDNSAHPFRTAKYATVPRRQKAEGLQFSRYFWDTRNWLFGLFCPFGVLGVGVGSGLTLLGVLGLGLRAQL